MSLFTPSQAIRRKTWFSAAVTGTPTAQLYVDNTATGSAVNGTGSGAEWDFVVTLPSGLSAGSSIQMVATATVDSRTERNELASGTIATTTTKTEIASASRDSILDRVLSGNHDAAGTVGKVLQALVGITSLLAILKKIARNDFTDATAESEIGGTYDDAKHSLEAIGDDGDAIKAKTDTIAKGTYQVSSNYNPVTKEITLYQGDDYLAANGRETDIELDLPGVDLDGATAAFGAKGKYDPSESASGNASVVDVGGTYFLRLEFPRAKISGTPGCYEYDAEVYDATTGAVVTTVAGDLTLKESKTPLVS